MPTTIADLWIPDLWIQGVTEKQATYPTIFTSGIVTRNPMLDEVATGPGVSVNIPFFKDITDQADGIQIENTPPVTDNGIGSSKMIGIPLNRENKDSVTAMSAQLSGTQPLDEILLQLAKRRLKQRNSTLISIMRGSFGSAGAAGVAAALGANRYTVGGNEIFLETAAGVSDANRMTPDVFIYSKAMLGELQDDLEGGCFICHPNIKARLESLDALNFKTGVPSALGTINTYRGIPIYVSSKLVRPGTTSGYVYDSYLVARGVIGYGEKPQAGDTRDVASLQYFRNPDVNNEAIYDRTRFIIHPNGMKWVGVPAGPSASNAELQAPGNWKLAFQTPDRAGMVCFRTN